MARNLLLQTESTFTCKLR